MYYHCARLESRTILGIRLDLVAIYYAVLVATT